MKDKPADKFMDKSGDLARVNSEPVITETSTVTLHFSLALEDGSIIDSNFDGAPATFTMGDGSLLPGFEDALVGLSIDQRNSFVISPERGFGQHNPSNLQTLKRKEFAADMDLSVGLVISFADAAKGELPGVISTIGDEEVIVDFNHPLAGKAILFEVQIISIETADAVPAGEHSDEGVISIGGVKA